MKPLLSVIVPAYNEEENFRRNKLGHVYNFFKSQDYTFEILIVNDGSTDNTLALLNEFKNGKPEVAVIDNHHQGKAGTVTTGMLQAYGKYRLFTDFDQSTPIEEINKLWPFFKRGHHMVIGSREVQGAAREKEPWYRHLMGKGFNTFVQILAVPGIHDTQCGFKMMTDKLAMDVFPKLKATVTPKKDAFTGAFDVELLYLAKRLGYKIAEVPVQWKHVSSKRVSPVKDSIRMFWQLVQIRWTVLTGSYEK